MGDPNERELGRYAHIIDSKRLSITVNSVFEGELGHKEGPKASPVCGEREKCEASLDPLDEVVPHHGIIITHLVPKFAFVVCISLHARLLLSPDVESILGHHGGVGDKEERIDEVHGRKYRHDIVCQLCSAGHDRLRYDQAHEVDEVEAEVRSVPEKETSEELELSNGEVCEGTGLAAFFPKDSNSNVRSLNHVHVIGTVSDSQSRLVLADALDECD